MSGGCSLLAVGILTVLLGCSGGRTPAGRPAEAVALDSTFARGMTFAHEGYRGHNGYGGDLVGPSLDSLMRLGVNSVAIVPYTFMRSANSIDSLPVPRHYGAENDSAVRISITQARARGLRVMLKPQIWVRQAWPGEIDFTTEAEWDRFFNAYTAWMMHYARMAQDQGVESLCIGTELTQATLKYPQRWRALIADVRRAYDGTLTYAANWGQEFEQLTFWDALDVIGLNSYYPLSYTDAPTDAELEAGARQWMRMADSVSLAHDRPLWLTEVGYRSVARAWINPHADAGDRPADAVAQERCYQALATAARQSTHLRGMFIWKWPSYLGHRESREGNATGFVPGGKPAGAVLRELYGGSSRRTTPAS